jgi:hypothetical protein
MKTHQKTQKTRNRQQGIASLLTAIEAWLQTPAAETLMTAIVQAIEAWRSPPKTTQKRSTRNARTGFSVPDNRVATRRRTTA